jgi:hypothetical protein
MFKVDDQTYQAILEAVAKCATNCFFRGAEYQRMGCEGKSEQMIGEEYKHCMNEIFKILGGELKQ